MRPIGRQRGAFRQRQGGAAVDHARQCLFARTQVIDQAVPHFADKAGADGNARQRRGERRLPGPRHDQRIAITLGAQAGGERAVERQGEALARQVEHDAVADAGHVVEEGRHHGRGQHVDRAAREPLIEEADHAVAAHEIADPHIGHDQDRGARGGRRLPLANKIIVRFQQINPPASVPPRPLIDPLRRPRRHCGRQARARCCDGRRTRAKEGRRPFGPFRGTACSW